MEEVKRGAKGDLVRQVIEPRGNAFVEVYAAELDNRPLELFADGWEEHLRGKLPDDLKTRECSLDIAIDGRPAILRKYSGVSEAIASGSIILTTYRNGAVYFVFGMWREDIGGLAQPTTLAATSIRFR